MVGVKLVWRPSARNDLDLDFQTLTEHLAISMLLLAKKQCTRNAEIEVLVEPNDH